MFVSVRKVNFKKDFCSNPIWFLKMEKKFLLGTWEALISEQEGSILHNRRPRTAATAGLLHERRMGWLYDLPFVRLGDPVHVRLFASHLLHKCLLNTNNKEKG